MSPYLIPLFGMLIPLVLVPTALGLRHAKLQRELEHTERMRAMELGRTLPQDESIWTLPKISVAIGVGVPLGAFSLAWMTTQTTGFQDIVWAAAGTVGTFAVVCGSVLAGLHSTQRARAESAPFPVYHARKEPLDADAYDVAGARG